ALGTMLKANAPGSSCSTRSRMRVHMRVSGLSSPSSEATTIVVAAFARPMMEGAAMVPASAARSVLRLSVTVGFPSVEGQTGIGGDSHPHAEKRGEQGGKIGKHGAEQARGSQPGGGAHHLHENADRWRQSADHQIDDDNHAEQHGVDADG